LLLLLLLLLLLKVQNRSWLFEAAEKN